MKRAFVIMAAIMALVVVAAAPLALAAPGKSKPAKPNQSQGNKNGAKKRYRPFTANGGSAEVTASLGVAADHGGALPAEDLLQRAVEELQKARQEGNCVRVAPPAVHGQLPIG